MPALGLALSRPFGGRARTDVLAFSPMLEGADRSQVGGSACALLATTEKKEVKHFKKEVSASLAPHPELKCMPSEEVYQVEYACLDTDADRLRGDVNNPTFRIFRVADPTLLMCRWGGSKSKRIQPE